MSTVRELADAEAERAEAEPDEEEATEEEEATRPEPEPEPEPDDGAEQTAKAIERELTRHEKAFAKAVGVDPSDLFPCPTCGASGFLPEPLDEPPELRTSDATQACPDCDGFGRVLSGSRVPDMAAIACERCSGFGYVRSAGLAPVPPQAEGVSASPQATLSVAPAYSAEDVQRLQAEARRLGLVVIDTHVPTTQDAPSV